MAKEQSLAYRAVIAVLLTVGFYFLAIAIGLGAIALPVILTVVTKRVIIQLYIASIITGCVILYAIFPRRDRFIAPGPLLTEGEFPKLFSILKDIAGKTQQEMPKQVYLLHEFNAWVAQRGGSGQFGGERFMGIGLPLLKAMTVSEFKSVMAHEFGHFHHGDTKLGPWIYKTRSAIGRTIMELQERESWLQAPFRWYGKMFLQVTHAISRNQEFIADKLAALTAGKSSMISSLKRMARDSFAYDAYWRYEFVPVIGSGFLPPLIKGYELFMQSADVQKMVAQVSQQELGEGTANKYDTHPALRERIEAIEQTDIPDADMDESPAMDLLGDAEELERLLMKTIIVADKFAVLKAIEWPDVTEAVYLDIWKSEARNNGKFLASITPRHFPDIAENPQNYISRFSQVVYNDPQLLQGTFIQMGAAIGAGFTLMLVRQNWDFISAVGDSIRLRRGEFMIEPFITLQHLAQKKISKEEWERMCEQTGMADMSLALPKELNPKKPT